MDALQLSRLQFGLTAGFHYIFPPLNIGLGLILVFMEGIYLRTKNPVYEAMTHFWVKIFGLIFAIGVASGIVLEFQFGTNWATFSRYVGDVFGSALAAEGVFAFFLESGFLALLLFGWDKISPRMHFFSTVMVAAGAHFSAVWIIVANSWQQTPAGHHIVADAAGRQRAEIVDFWAMVFNPSTVERLTHVLFAAYLAAAFFVLSVSAYYLLRKRHEDFARRSFRIAAVVAAVAGVGQLVTGHQSADVVAEYQPAKLAAFEGHFEKQAPADLYLLGWVDERNEKTSGIKLPGMLSWLVHGDRQQPVTGLRSFAPADRPPVNAVFQSYHLMVAIGMGLLALGFVALAARFRPRLLERRWLLWIFVVAVLGPQLANQAGWFTTEVGRQPWVVQGLLRTADAGSPAVSAAQVVGSIAMFGLIYLLLFALFVYLLNDKIHKGPSSDHLSGAGQRA